MKVSVAHCLSDQGFLVMHLSGRKWASLVVQTVKNLLAMQETLVRSLSWEDSPELQYSCLERESPWGPKESDTEQLTPIPSTS